MITIGFRNRKLTPLIRSQLKHSQTSLLWYNIHRRQSQCPIHISKLLNSRLLQPICHQMLIKYHQQEFQSIKRRPTTFHSTNLQWRIWKNIPWAERTNRNRFTITATATDRAGSQPNNLQETMESTKVGRSPPGISIP